MYDMLAKICMFLKVCDICLRAKVKLLKSRPLHLGILMDNSPTESLSFDIKFMSNMFY